MKNTKQNLEEDFTIRVAKNDSFLFTKIPTKTLDAVYLGGGEKLDQILETNISYNKLTIVLMNILYHIVEKSTQIPDKKVEKLQRILDEIISKGYCKEHHSRSVEHKIHKLLQII